MKSAIFDLDGTLADTSGDLIAAANACFINLGHENLLDPIKDILTAFQGGRAMLKLGFSRLDMTWDESDINIHYPLLLEYYAQSLDMHTVLYDGVEYALKELINRGYVLGICTNKPEKLAIDLVKKLGIMPYFKVLLGADSLSVRKPNPEHLLETVRRIGSCADKSVLIGDTMTDRMTCRNANILSVLVGFGPSGFAIEKLKPDAVLNHYNDLPDLLDKLI